MDNSSTHKSLEELLKEGRVLEDALNTPEMRQWDADFVQGFKDHCPEGLDDWDTDTPWGEPWTWADASDYFDDDLPGYECGKRWAELRRKDIEEDMAASRRAGTGDAVKSKE